MGLRRPCKGVLILFYLLQDAVRGFGAEDTILFIFMKIILATLRIMDFKG